MLVEGYEEIHLELSFSKTDEKLEIRQMVHQDLHPGVQEAVLDDMWDRAKEALREKDYL